MSEDQGSQISEPPDSSEKVAREFLQWIEGRLKAVRSEMPHHEKLTFEDKLKLGDAWETLRPSFNELAAKFFEPYRMQDPVLADLGYHCAWGLMYSAFLAGQGTGYNEAVEATNRKDRSINNTIKSMEAKKRKYNATEEKIEAICCQINPRSQFTNDQLAAMVIERWTEGEPQSLKVTSKKISKLKKQRRI